MNGSNPQNESKKHTLFSDIAEFFSPQDTEIELKAAPSIHEAEVRYKLNSVGVSFQEQAKQLYQIAEQVRRTAYAPFSGFQVGAALLTSDGTVYRGVNVENSSFPLTNCAERSAIFAAISDGKRDFAAIAICGGKGSDTAKPCYPCGACRQVMAEFCSKDFPIIVSDGICLLGDLLPFSFSLKDASE